MTKVTASRIVGSRVLSTNGSFFLAFAFINVNYIILQLLHAVQMHKDANAIAHAQDTMLSQNGQARYGSLYR